MGEEKVIPDPIHVAVAIVIDHNKKILISRRPKGVHLAGLWEFPGGKLEQNESVFSALKRELSEEVGIEIQGAQPLIKVVHNYSEKSVKLDTWIVQDWSGEALGLEGQQIRWVSFNELSEYEFPAADKPIIDALECHF